MVASPPQSLWVTQPACLPGLPGPLGACLSRFQCCLRTPRWTWDCSRCRSECETQHVQKQPGAFSCCWSPCDSALGRGVEQESQRQAHGLRQSPCSHPGSCQALLLTYMVFKTKRQSGGSVSKSGQIAGPLGTWTWWISNAMTGWALTPATLACLTAPGGAWAC